MQSWCVVMRLLGIVLCCNFLLLVKQDAVIAQEILRGPYLQTMELDENAYSLVVRWRTDEHDISDEVSMVKAFKVNADGTVQEEPIIATSVPLDCENNDCELEEPAHEEYWTHIVTLQGLEPTTKYFYNIGTYEVDDEDHHVEEGWADDDSDTDDESYYFITPSIGEDPSQETLHVLMIGDQGTGSRSITDSTRAVTVRNAFWGEGNYLDEKGISAEDVSFVLTVGDNAYSHGTDAEWQEAHFNTFEELIRNKIFYMNVGNHDLDNKEVYYSNFTMPTHEYTESQYPGSFYKVEYDNALFICLDSNGPSYYPGSFLEAYRASMIEFLTETLEKNTKKWVMVAVHHPPYSAGNHESDDPGELSLKWTREELTPIFDAYGVDLVLSGDDHNYQRSHLIRGIRGYSTDELPNDDDYHFMQEGQPIEDEDDFDSYYKTSINSEKPYQDEDDVEGTVYVVAGSSGKKNDKDNNHPNFVAFGDESEDDVVLGRLGSVHLEITDEYLQATFISPTVTDIEASTYVVNDVFRIYKTDEETIEAEVDLKVNLEGAYDAEEGKMTNYLVELGLLPLKQPYSMAPFYYNGTEELEDTHSNMTDWVLVEARCGQPDLATPDAETVVVERHAGIILRNGDIVNTEGDPLLFTRLSEGQEYYFVVRHRNHIDIMSAEPLEAEDEIYYNFTNDTDKAYGLNQQKENEEDGEAMMYAGDFYVDQIIQITDLEYWIGTSAMLESYDSRDANLDGVVQLSDYDLWLPNNAKIGIDELHYHHQFE